MTMAKRAPSTMPESRAPWLLLTDTRGGRAVLLAPRQGGRARSSGGAPIARRPWLSCGLCNRAGPAGGAR